MVTPFDAEAVFGTAQIFTGSGTSDRTETETSTFSELTEMITSEPGRFQSSVLIFRRLSCTFPTTGTEDTSFPSAVPVLKKSTT